MRAIRLSNDAMQLVTKRGVISVLRRMMYACDDDTDQQFTFSNLDDNVDFRISIAKAYEDHYRLDLDVDVFDAMHDDAKHPAVYAWLKQEHHGLETIRHWGPFDCEFKDDEGDDVRHDVYHTVVRLQRMQTCACNRFVFFDDAEVCLRCDAVSTGDDMTTDKCCICQDAALRFQSVRSTCCFHYMHKQCHDMLCRHARDEDVVVRCPTCRRDLHVI